MRKTAESGAVFWPLSLPPGSATLTFNEGGAIEGGRGMDNKSVRSRCRVAALIVSLGVAAVAPLQPARAEAAAGPLAGKQLAWEETFDGSVSNLDARWSFQNGPSGHILCSRWRDNVAVSNGVCRLLNKKETRAGQAWTSASLWTKRLFQYGTFECRYRYGASTGLNNSFWLMTQGGTTNTPGRFEIDINEGHSPNEVNMNIHN